MEVSQALCSILFSVFRIYSFFYRKFYIKQCDFENAAEKNIRTFQKKNCRILLKTVKKLRCVGWRKWLCIAVPCLGPFPPPERFLVVFTINSVVSNSKYYCKPVRAYKKNIRPTQIETISVFRFNQKLHFPCFFDN